MSIIKCEMNFLIRSQTSTVQPFMLVWERVNNLIPHITGHVITYPCLDYTYSMSVKGAPGLLSKTQPIRSHVSKSLLTTIDFIMVMS